MHRTEEPRIRVSALRGALLLILPWVLGLAGCELLGPATEHFVIHVDSVSVPSVVSSSDTLKVRFYGAVGPDGCWRLAGVDRQVTPDSLVVKFWGEHRRAAGNDCAMMAVAMDYEERVPPPLNAPFVVIASQPDGSSLGRVVTVQQEVGVLRQRCCSDTRGPP